MITYKQLLEMPYLNPEVKTHTGDWGFYTSDSALKRDFKLIKSISKYHCYMSNKDNHIRVYVKESEVVGNNNRQVGFIRFYRKSNIKIPNKLLQVVLVEMSPEIEAKGIASTIYVELLKHGFIIVSDTAQYLGGQLLWKKLAKDSETSGYQVRIWDNSSKQYLQNNGQDILYNSKNIEDSEIWSSHWDFRMEDRVLVLSKK